MRNGRTQGGAGERPMPPAFPRPVLVAGAVFYSDGGRLICRFCAGCSALYTGRDISGQKVDRMPVEDVRDLPGEYERMSGQPYTRPVTCDAGCTTLSPIAGADGWPMATINEAHEDVQRARRRGLA